MSEPDQRPRSFLWLWVLLALALVASLALFVMVRLQLTAEERMFVGTWRAKFDGLDIGRVTFRPNRTGNGEGDVTFSWAVHGTRAVVWKQDERSAVTRFWDRLAGLESGGIPVQVELLESDRIVFTNSGHLHEFTR